MTDTALNGVVSEEDARRRERAAFVAGAERWNGAPLGAGGRPAMEREARGRYPIRKKVPRVVKLSGGEVSASMAAGIATFRLRDWEDPHRIGFLCAADIRILADLAARPYDEVEE